MMCEPAVDHSTPAGGIVAPVPVRTTMSLESGSESLEMTGIEVDDVNQDKTARRAGQKRTSGYQTREGSEVSAFLVNTNNESI